jgi:hypothetical protein
MIVDLILKVLAWLSAAGVLGVVDKLENSNVCLVVGSGTVVSGVEYVKDQDSVLRPLLDYEKVVIALNSKSNASR